MRKRIALAGVILVVIGLAAIAGGFYLASRSLVPTISQFAGKLTTTTLNPNQSLTLGSDASNHLAIAAYQDSSGKPLDLVSTGAASKVSRQAQVNGTTLFITVLVAGSSQANVSLVNNQSQTLTVEYGFSSKTNLSSVVTGGVALLLGGVLVVLGIIVVIVGVVLKPRQPPAVGAWPQSQA